MPPQMQGARGAPLHGGKLPVQLPGPTPSGQRNVPPHGQPSALNLNGPPSVQHSGPPSGLNLNNREPVQTMRPSPARTQLPNRATGLNQEKKAATEKSGVSGWEELQLLVGFRNSFFLLLGALF